MQMGVECLPNKSKVLDLVLSRRKRKDNKKPNQPTKQTNLNFYEQSCRLL